MRVSLLVGAILGVVNYLRLMLMFPGMFLESLVVSVTGVLTIVLANLIGGALPVLISKIGLDPALVATPIMTTICDALALLAYFAMAKLMLPI